jgi:hypothetical protein
MKKTLYFEGAGWVPCGEVANCRIRTAFTNNKGKRIYLEMTGMEVTKRSSKLYKNFKNVGFIDYCHYITGNHEDCNENRISYDRNYTFEYTNQNILNFVNDKLNCSFDEVVILNDLAGYRVFADNDNYNYGDVFDYDPELTKKRISIKDYFYQLEKSEGKQYPNFSLWADSKEKNLLHLLRHFNGYNKHWSIYTNTENWLSTIRETKLGKDGC